MKQDPEDALWWHEEAPDMEADQTQPPKTMFIEKSHAKKHDFFIGSIIY